MGVEPTSPAWEAGVITVIRRPPSNERRPSYYSAFAGDEGAARGTRTTLLVVCLDLFHPHVFGNARQYAGLSHNRRRRYR